MWNISMNNSKLWYKIVMQNGRISDCIPFWCLFSLSSRSHSGSVVDTVDNVNAVDWSWCRSVAVDVALDVDVEVADHGVAVVVVVVVVVVDVILVVVGVAAIAKGAKKCAIFFFSFFCCWRSCSCGRGTLWMSEGAFRADVSHLKR
jgi:hypothetical protein